jgi:hypothetical protein
VPQQVPQQTGNPFGVPWQQQSVLQQPAMYSPAPIAGQQTDFFSSQPPQGFAAQQQQYQANQLQAAAPQNPYPQTQPFYQQTQGPSNPYEQQTQQLQQQQQQQFMPQPQQSQYTGQRHDKSSILALYNYPQLAPAKPLQALPENAEQQNFAAPQRSVTMPISMGNAGMGSRNPFGGHVSNESVDFQNLNGGAAGRQSPDAFTGLSTRFQVR